jgi:Peptidase family M1 domain
MPRARYLAAVLPLALFTAAGAQSIATNSPTPLSVRIVGYTIDAKLDAKNKTVDATEVLAYKNLTGQPQDTFPFHLYLNAFRPQSTFSLEAHQGGTRGGGENSYPPEKIGAIDISQLSVDGMGDLTGQMQFIAPDDGNMQDHTVMQVKLPRAIAPGETVTFRMKFKDKFPISIERNGYKRDFIMGGQWFPKVGVWWHGAWNCHQYHASSEFFADFGTFNVKLNVPKRYIIGASGVPTGEQDMGDGTKSLSFYGEDIHDFAWAASPHFVISDDTFQGSMGPVKLHALVLESHVNQSQRYLSILKRTMQKFDEWYGPFPYKEMTLIDPEPDSQIFGMEYPTLITGGTSWLDPDWALFNELVTEHEFGHQYWYGMVATNEFEEAWMDEGINSYTETKVLASLFGKDTSAINGNTIAISDLATQRVSYMGVIDYDPMTRWAWKYVNSGSYAGISYGKTATVLTTLEAVIGEQAMNNVMRVYFMRYRFQHPNTADFLNTVKEVTGRQDLDSYFTQAVYGTNVLDFSISDVNSEPVKWWDPPGRGKPECSDLCRDTVTVHRKGDFILPVTVEVRFDDGSRVREFWDGKERWTRFTYMKKAKIVSAEVDPDHVIWMDKNFFNNSFVVASDGTAARKLSNYWMFAHQLFAQWMTWLV